MDRRTLLRALAATSVTMSSRLSPFLSRGGGRRLTRRTPRSSFHRVNGVRLHVLEWGEDSAPPMVLLHAAPLNAHAWDTFASAMASRFHVVAPDARGFGESEWGAPDSYVADTFTADLHGLVQAMDLTRFVLGGNSLGGSTAIWYASQHPEMVERLIVVDTSPGPKAPEPTPPGAAPSTPPRARPAGAPPPPPPGPFATPAEAIARVNEVVGPAFAAAGAPWPGLGEAIVRENLKRDANGAWQWRYDREGTASGYQRSLGDPRRWPNWRSITAPTLVVRGGRSPALPQAVAEDMVRENPHATVAVVPDSGHYVALEQPAAFEAAVRGWLGADLKGGSGGL